MSQRPRPCKHFIISDVESTRDLVTGIDNVDYSSFVELHWLVKEHEHRDFAAALDISG